jgi:hypothetical protein
MGEEAEITIDDKAIDASNSTDIATVIYETVTSLSFADKESIIKIVAGLVEIYHENATTNPTKAEETE